MVQQDYLSKIKCCKSYSNTYLFQGIDKALQPCEMADELEYPEYPHDADEPHYLAGLAKDVEVLHGLDERRQDVGQDGQKVDEIHGLQGMNICIIAAKATSEKVWR